jgi:hypothetical protein
MHEFSNNRSQQIETLDAGKGDNRPGISNDQA